MGLFKGLLGKYYANGPNQGSNPKLSPGYQRVHKWIESRVGPIDYADPNLRTKLDDLLGKEKVRHPSARGKLSFTRSGNDTVVTGDTKPFKGRLRRLGLQWDRRTRSWVGRNKIVTENDIDIPSELVGLKKYIETIPYRAKFGDHG